MVDKGRQVVNEVAYNVKQEVTREVGVDPGREAGWSRIGSNQSFCVPKLARLKFNILSYLLS